MDTPVAPQGRPVIGPAVPTSTARSAQRPLGITDIQIRGGPWARWQELNRQVSLPMGVKWLDDAGNLDNLRLAVGESHAAYRGRVFSDSDVYKMLEAASWERGRLPGSDFDDFLRSATELLERVQCDDGYLNSYYQGMAPERRYTELTQSHEMYCAGHLIQAAVAARRVGASERLFEVARRFADHLMAVFGADAQLGLDGHPEVETALVELYRTTGERSYLDLATKLIDRRGNGLVGTNRRGSGYFFDHKHVRDADTLVSHAVRGLYLEAGVVDVSVETGDETLLQASIRRWEDMVATKTSLTGGVGSRHAGESFGDRYELPPDRAYNETCAAIASIHWSWRLLLATGDSRYADLIERTLFNAFAASTSTDGTRFFYVNALQRRHDHHEGDEPRRRREWFECACCPPNIMRLVASLGTYVATGSDEGVYLHQFAPGTIEAPVGHGDVALTVDTDYPWSGLVRIIVDRAPDTAWALNVRVPGWCPAVHATVGGERLAATPNEHGYASWRRHWQVGDTLTVEMDMPARLIYPDLRIDALRGCAAIERGPLVYCFEQVDQPDDVDLDQLMLAPDLELRTTDHEDYAGLGRSVVIQTRAKAVALPSSACLPYSAEPPEEKGTQTTFATAIPYFQWDNRDGQAMRVWVPLFRGDC